MLKTLALIFALMAIVLSSVNARTLKDINSNFVIDEAFESLDDIWGADMADSPAPAPAPEPELPAVAKFIEMKQKMVGAVVPMPTIAEPIEAEMAPAPAPDGAVYDDFSIDY